VIGKIASIEVPLGAWNELVPQLIQNITKHEIPPNQGLRYSSLEALGYVCEEIPKSLESSSSQILQATASGMAESEPNDIKLSATTCLLNSMEFIRSNMASETDRNVIMSMVFSVATCPDEDVRVVAYQCLAQIADSYYEYIGAHMNVIFDRTTKAIRAESENVAKQAVEFWCTTCDVELEIQDEEVQLKAGQKSRNQNIIPAAVPHLVPVLLSVLTKQSDDPEEDEYTLALASATCIGLCSQVAKDGIVAPVLPFVQKYVNSGEWREREAAILAFGCILEGPNKEDMAKLVRTAFEMIIGKMADPHPMVKDTAAWTVGRICALLPEVIDGSSLPKLLHAVSASLSDPSPKIASNSCWAIHNLASAVGVDEGTSPLSGYFEGLLHALFAASRRPDVNKSNLQTSIFEAINALVTSAAPDVNPIIEKALPVLYGLLSNKVAERAHSASEELNEIQALLCGSLQAIVTKLPAEKVVPHVQILMQVLLQVIEAKNSTVLEEALMAIGAIADTVLDAFVPYADLVKPHILNSLQNAQEYHPCKVAITATGDVSRALKLGFIKWSDEIMTILLRHLTNVSIERTLKVHMIECIGDIATAVGSNADRYLQHALPMFMEASTIKFPVDDWDNQEYVQQLREGILTAYIGIISGLTSDPNNNKIGQFVQFPGLVDSIRTLLDVIANDDPNVRSEQVLRGACGLIFDLVEFCGLKQQMRIPAVQQIFTQAKDKNYSEDTNIAGADVEAVSHILHLHLFVIASLSFSFLSPSILVLSCFVLFFV
jgi:importin subunit beta-1